MSSAAPLWLLVLAGTLAPACKSESNEPPENEQASYSEPPENEQASYSYPGCAPSDALGCPRMGTFGCAAEAIQARHASCSATSDCVLAGIANCAAMFTCTGTVVNVDEKEAFLREFQVEVDRYCALSSCRVQAGCLPPGTYAPACIDGRCTLVSSDAGAGDSSLDDAANGEDASGDAGDAGPA